MGILQSKKPPEERTSLRAKFPAELTTYKHKGQSVSQVRRRRHRRWSVPKLREGKEGEMTLRWPLALGDHLLITSTMKREEAEKLCEQAVRNGGLREREGPKSRKSCGRHPWKVPCPPSLLSVFLPLCKSDFPSLVGLPACLPFPSTCPHLPLPPPSSTRPPAWTFSINFKFEILRN